MTNTPTFTPGVICLAKVNGHSQEELQTKALEQARAFFHKPMVWEPIVRLEIGQYAARVIAMATDEHPLLWQAEIPITAHPIAESLSEDPPTSRRDQRDDLRHGAMRTATPFTFSRDENGYITLDSAVFQALGAASTCWEHMEGTGEFDSTRAKSIGETLLLFIRNGEEYLRDRTSDDAKGWH